MGVELAVMSGLVSAGMSFSQASKARKGVPIGRA